MTFAQAKARFASGATTADGGPFIVRERTRTCNTVTGCTDWTYPASTTFAFDSWEDWIPGPGWSAQEDCQHFSPGSFPSVGGSLGFVVYGGSIEAQLTSPQLGVVACGDVTSESAGCPDAMVSPMLPALPPISNCHLPNDVGPGADSTIYPITALGSTLADASGSQVSFSLRVTEHYAYARTHSESKADGAGTSTVVEYALYASLDGSPLPTGNAP
jgi:hypothetical protein